MEITLSIIIVNWNTVDLLKDCLESIFSKKYKFSYEVIVSDNGSADDSVKMVETSFPRVRILKNNVNLGFAKGNNVAMSEAKGKYFLLLNSDTIVLDKAFDIMVDYLNKNSQVMMVGPRVLNKDGSFQSACRRSLPNPKNSMIYLFGLSKILKKDAYKNSYKDITDEEEIEAISGSVMMFRREVFDVNGGLDEDFFMYGEDLDFCKRVIDKGWKIVYLNNAEIIHLGGASSKKRKISSLLNFYEAMWIYYCKHFYKDNNGLFNMLVWIGIKLKLLLALIKNFYTK